VTREAAALVRCGAVLSCTIRPPVFDDDQSLTSIELYDRFRT
jgi:hypothetical protein